MLWGRFAAGGTGALHKINGITRRENYVDILKQHLRTSVRKLKLGRKWVFQMDNDLAYHPKLWQNGLRTTKSRYWSGHHKALTIEHLWAELKKRVRAMRPTNLTQLHQLCQEQWSKIHPTYCGKLVECYPKHFTQVKPFKGNATKY